MVSKSGREGYRRDYSEVCMIWAKVAAGLMALAIVLGSFGAHALKSKLTPEMLEIYRVGVLYQIIHALGLFAVAWLLVETGSAKVHNAGILLTLGILLFSGSLYALSLSGIKMFGAVTPIGGLCFLIGWVLLFLAL